MLLSIEKIHLEKKATLRFLAKWPYEVEAAGIEPASRDVSEQTSTCVFGQFKSHEEPPRPTGCALHQPGTNLVLPVLGDETERVGFGDRLVGPSDWGHRSEQLN